MKIIPIVSEVSEKSERLRATLPKSKFNILLPEAKPIPPQTIPKFAGDVEREVCFTILGECNLKCAFCFVEDVRPDKFTSESLDLNLQLLDEALSKIEEPVVKIKVAGGELFMDKFDDFVFEEYNRMMETIGELAKKHKKDLRVGITTNMIFKKVDRVIDFLLKWDIPIRGSFDLVGRFPSQKVVDLFTKNMFLFKERGVRIGVNFVASRPNMDAIRNHGEFFPEFKKLYDNFDMRFEYYSPNGVDNWEVSERDVYDWFVYMYENYPKCSTVSDLVKKYREKQARWRECSESVWISRMIVGECCDRMMEAQKFLSNKGCFACPHLGYCAGSCYRLFSEDSFCYIREFYEYLERHGLEGTTESVLSKSQQ